MVQSRNGLGQVLKDHGLVSAEQLDSAMQEEMRTGRSAWRILVENGVVAERDLVRARAAQVGVDFVDVRTARPDRSAVSLVPEPMARRLVALPMSVEGHSLTVAMADPSDPSAIEELGKASEKKIKPVAAFRHDVAAALEIAYTQPASSGDVGQLGADDLLVEAPEAPEAPDEEEKDPNLADFMEALIESAGSDLHLTSGLPPMMRVDGDLKPLRGYRRLLPKDLQEIVYAMLTQKQREIFEDKLELDVSYSLPGKGRFRVNVFQQRDSVGSVMRLIPFEIKTVDQLGLPDTVREFTKLKRGLVLVTGITGSGKSTTLAALIDMINSERPDHIMTVENPIEFLHRHKKSVVNQREVGTDTHGFTAALKHVLRQDPDVILVGELRDLETIQVALTAAETGHLVFATLHTSDAPQTVDRIIDVFPPHQQEQIRVQLASSLQGVVSQQLLKTTDGEGRVVACEVLVVTPAIRNLIREGKTYQIYSAIQSGGQHSMIAMDQSLAALVRTGKVSYDEAVAKCSNLQEFDRLCGRA